MVDWLIRFAPAMHTSGVSVSPGNQGRGLEICLMPHCDQPQKKKCRWCPLHNCHLDNMKYAVAHNKVNCSKEKRIAWSEEMKDVNKAIAAITQQEESNAGGSMNFHASFCAQPDPAQRDPEYPRSDVSVVSKGSQRPRFTLFTFLTPFTYFTIPALFHTVHIVHPVLTVPIVHFAHVLFHFCAMCGPFVSIYVPFRFQCCSCVFLVVNFWLV